MKCNHEFHVGYWKRSMSFNCVAHVSTMSETLSTISEYSGKNSPVGSSGSTGCFESPCIYDMGRVELFRHHAVLEACYF